MQHVVVVVPVNAHVDKTQDITEKRGYQRRQVPHMVAVRRLQLQNMIVMMIAITPSLNASSRPLLIYAPRPHPSSFLVTA